MKLKMIFTTLLAILMAVSAGCSANSGGAVPESQQAAGDPTTNLNRQSQAVELESGKVPQSGKVFEAQTAQSVVLSGGHSASYTIVDTSQGTCYNNSQEIPCPSDGSEFFGQDAQYWGVAASYLDNDDGTISDLNTGLMWQQYPGEKMTYAEAVEGADSFSLAGYDDWRLPTIKELYSLILFDGTDISRCDNDTCDATPFIDTRYFRFEYGNESAGERTIDSQWASSTVYVSTVMDNSQCMFGVNFADGRIKCYGFGSGGGMNEKTFYVIYVRGDNYGQNEFEDNGDGTISDNATGLMWQQTDSGTALNWQESLAYCEDLTLVGYSDWRLPDAKELQSIVDYTRSPDTTGSAAIDPMFNVTEISNEAGQLDFPFFWSSTTHLKLEGNGSNGVYISFGRALGYMNNTFMDVHGAGAQRSDPKTGAPSYGFAPQGDVVRVDNYARCVRGGSATLNTEGAAYEVRPTVEVAVSMEGMGSSSGQQPPSGKPPAGGSPSGDG